MRLTYLVALLIPLAASATTVTLERDGQTVATGEVCRFPAGDRENPFQRWLSSGELTCVSASGDVQFPPGVWNVFARTGDGVSMTPMLIDAAAPPQSITLSLQRSAPLTAQLREGQRGVVYAPRRASAIPLDDRGRATVPVEEDLWLFIVEKSVPVGVMSIATERTIDARIDAPSSVVGSVHVPESDRAALSNARGLSLPAIRMGSRTADPLPPFDLLNGAFFRIGGATAGPADVDLGGRGWIPHRRTVRVSATLTAATEPLVARPSATIIVNWSGGDDLPALDRSLGSCGAGDRSAQYEISIARCASPERPGMPVDPSTCEVFRQETFPPETPFGSFAVEDIAPGTYRAELKFGKLPPATALVTALPAQQTSMWVRAAYLEVYGSVTRGGQPLREDVSIQFPGGVGFAPSDSSEYRGVLLSPLGIDARINVAACDGAPTAFVLTDRPILRRSARIDIDIPVNELLINVTDTFTRMPISGSSVRYALMSRGRPVVNGTVATDADGRVRLTSIPEREMRILVSAPGYEKDEVEPFSIAKTEEKVLDVQLVPLRGNRGKISSARAFENGAVFWYSPSGHETERVDLAPDGTFVYARSHEASETMAVVSFSHPLWMSRFQSVEVRFPEAAARTFDVGVRGADARDTRYVAVVVAGLRVPHPALRQHQFLRGLQPVIRGGGPLRIRDIAETGPIDVLLGPRVEEVTTRAGTMDLFAFPQFATAPRLRLPPGATSVNF